MNTAKNVARLAACLLVCGCSQVQPFDGKGVANAVPALTIPADLTPLNTLDTYRVPAASSVSVAP